MKLVGRMPRVSKATTRESGSYLRNVSFLVMQVIVLMALLLFV